MYDAGRLGGEPVMCAEERVRSVRSLQAAGDEATFGCHLCSSYGPLSWSACMTERYMRAYRVMGGTQAGRSCVKKQMSRDMHMAEKATHEVC
mgnify:CR=1 FL=1